MKRLFLSALAALLVSLTGAAGPNEDDMLLREQVVRLHIRADSDEPAAQAVKLRVRDAILAETADWAAACGSAAEAAQTLPERLGELEACAGRVLREAGLSYAARASFGEEWYPARSYAGVTLPAGMYRGLVIELGSGEGENWWCVMFPPLCYQGETDEPVWRDGAPVGEDAVVVRWKVRELWERWRAEK